MLREEIIKSGTSIATLQECKDWVRVTSSDEDDLMNQIIDYIIPFCSDLALSPMNTSFQVSTWIGCDSADQFDLTLKYLGSTFSSITASAQSGNTITTTLNDIAGTLTITGQSDNDVVKVTYTSEASLPLHFKVPFLQVFADMYEARTAIGTEDRINVVQKVLARFKPFLQGQDMI